MLDKNKKGLLKVVDKYGSISLKELEDLPIEEQVLKELLKDIVKNNIFYFDPAEAVYYPQGKSYQWGIKLYLENIRE